MSRWTRRHFMRGTVAAGLVVGAGFAIHRATRWTKRSASERGQRFAAPYEAIRADLMATFPFLILPRETVDAFLEALGDHKMKPELPKAREIFLLSTDFFAYGEDESRPLGFQTLYDAYISPCYNPFASAS